MEVPTPERVKLTPEEDALFQKITFSAEDFRKADGDPDGSAAAQLTRLLLQRKAIPEVRLKYFTDPKFNIGGRGKSRKQAFEKNGRKGEEILRHGNFLKYLKYFIFGPDVPKATIAKLRKVVEDDLGTSGMVLDELCRVARAETRRLSKAEKVYAPEEFFKLALEIGLDLGTASTLRHTVRSVK